MTIELQADIKRVLDYCSVEWPDVDEDAVNKMSQEMKELGAVTNVAIQKCQQATKNLLAHNEGDAVEAFKDCMDKILGGPLAQLTGAANRLGDDLGELASQVTETKKALIKEAEPYTSGLGEIVMDVFGGVISALYDSTWPILAGIDNVTAGGHYPLNYDDYKEGRDEGKKYDGTKEEREKAKENMDDLGEDAEAAGE